MIKATDVEKLYIKNWWNCQNNCGKRFTPGMSFTPGFWPEIHHIYFRSQYTRKDRDWLWNLSLLCWECHKLLHNWKLRDLDKKLKDEADISKPVEERSTEKFQIKKNWLQIQFEENNKQIMKSYKKNKIDEFKEAHNWMTPAQFKRKENKDFFKNLIKNNR